MQTLTIPKRITKGEDLVIVPRKEYEALLRFNFKPIEEVKLNVNQKKAIFRARKNLSQGNFLTLNELKQKLEATN